MDVVQFSAGGELLSIRLARSEMAGNKRKKTITASIVSLSLFVILGSAALVVWRYRVKHNVSAIISKVASQGAWRNDLRPEEFSGLHFFEMNSIQTATSNFSLSNKLGQGGFGSVYKGTLQDGQEFAVKRLSSSSGQGKEEFVNEIVLISKLQHRNLVRLLGCCIKGEEKLLIYEFMVNKSLDTFLFDSRKRLEIDWPKRFDIIQGIARGLLYLHHDSRLRVIHRDLKVSSILLDEKMNPKISDLGLARMYQGTEYPNNTRRVAGTLGYMSPEYAWTGIFSEKSDIYSFGVLLLEIISGEKISRYINGEEGKTLLAYAWESWSGNGGIDLLDQDVADSSHPSEVGSWSFVQTVKGLSEGDRSWRHKSAHGDDKVSLCWINMLESGSRIPLPGSLSLTYNLATGEKQVLTSWKTYTDPSPGDFVGLLTPEVPAQVFIMRGSTPHWRSGPWDKTRFTGLPLMDESYTSPFSLQQNVNGIMERTGNLTLRLQPTHVMFTVYVDLLGRVLAQFLQSVNASKGNSTSKDVNIFHPVANIKPPDFYEFASSVNAEGCYQSCLRNCSCLAFAYIQGIGCLMWNQELMDTVQYSSGGELLSIRLARSELDGNKRKKTIVASTVSLALFVILGFAAFGFWRSRVKHNAHISTDAWRNDLNSQDIPGLDFFEMNTIQTATDNFSLSNKLGQGGFGSVYKGKLQDGKEIAVKRLSSSSGQGKEEFMNKIVLISKLQHRNLVRVLGCCIEGEEKLLIYEFMVNKSLDTFLFDSRKRLEINWPKRFDIIQGIARGLLYLHHDSRLRVIHRDLKVSNILLDEKMTPKISDFGLARMYQGTEYQDNTRRIVGTLGYMSPEYAWTGMFSEKSDIYSFGVLLLEIISGEKISRFSFGEQGKTLLAYAWESWSENGGVDLLEQDIADSSLPSEVGRCVQIGLLCVQHQPVDRPNTLELLSMLTTTSDLPRPKQPTFALHNRDVESHFRDLITVNEITQSLILGR
ncbi:hypothetical protein AALP_AA2G029200 [Arabis alpina]|nr:hypothetical protein AALP_AA2G029200 [Arabis alpina]